MEGENRKQQVGRPPIVVVVGHVDHGKTTLLDYIRKSRVAMRETGGITQSIGAYQIVVKNGRTVTFIDTPGHAAFRGMRARGTEVADMAVLVVAADDGVMPQTRESIMLIKEVNLPFVVAITKVDKETAQVERVKSQLAEEGVLVEGWGGNVPVCLVSGVTGEGVEELLEMIMLLAEVEGVRESESGGVEAVVIEAKRTAARGPVATVIVRGGSLVVGSEVIAGKVQGKVRGMFDENGGGVREARSGMPVEVLGWEDVPEVGSVVRASLELQSQGAKIEEDDKREKKGVRGREGLKIILKVDSAGSLEAVENNLPEGIVVVKAGVGEVVERDVDEAVLVAEEGKMRPVVVGFNVRAGSEIEKLAEEREVKILKYSLIYELLGELTDLAAKYVEPVTSERVLGQAEVVAEFPFGKRRIAGCRIVSGRMTKGDRMHLKRGEEMIGDCRITSMRHVKEEVDRAEKGGEVGIIIAPQLDFKIGDVLVSYK